MYYGVKMRVSNGMVYFDKNDIRKRGDEVNGLMGREQDTFHRDSVKKAIQKLDARLPDAENDYKNIFRHETVEIALKRLEKQVLDVQANFGSKFRRENAQKLYRVNSSTAGSSDGAFPELPMTYDPDSQVYHENLHSSLQAFRIRKWRPLTPELVPQKTLTRCRPVSGRPYSSMGMTDSFTRPQTPSTDLDASRPSSRVRSAPLQARRPDTPRVDPGNFDTLSPRILSQLVTDPRPQTPNSTYGDIIEVKSSKRGKSRAAKEKQQKKSQPLLEGDVSSTSGVDSDGEDSGDDDDDQDESSSDDSDNDSISELEKGNEPPVDHNRLVPDLHLRPERLDHVYTPIDKRDMRRFDFDAEKLDIPPYEFECPIPSPFDKINFRLHARENSDWRWSSSVIGPVDPTLSVMFDRLVEIEKRQIETEEWEDRKLRIAKRRSVSRTAKSRDKRCCNACLQAACVGDCPNKRVPGNCCEKCHQPLCTGTCEDTKYDQRMRQPREDPVPVPPRPAVPQNCKTCQRRHNAKYINANHVVLGRPKSAYSTFSRGKNSAKPKDLRPKSAFNISECLSRSIEKIGLEPLQPTPPSTAKLPRPRSRGDMMPGKSYFSNLNRSLTELSIKRKRSAKTRKRVPVA